MGGEFLVENRVSRLSAGFDFRFGEADEAAA